VPRAVLKWPQGSFLTQAQMDDVRNRWEDRYGGPSNGGKIAILPDGGDLQVLSSGTKEFDLRNSKEDLRDQIRAAFKVPKVVLGDVEQVTLANAETSYQVFMRDVVDAALSKRYSHHPRQRDSGKRNTLHRSTRSSEAIAYHRRAARLACVTAVAE
jgi:phage portal protein BeeE